MLIKKMIISNELKKHFIDLGYSCVKPYNIVNKNDTVFISAGIQPLLASVRKGDLNDKSKYYISQPVIRTQFANDISEGFSIAFINSTTACFNKSEKEHNELVEDWLNLFYELGIKKEQISTREKDYERLWGDLLVKGKTKFYYCDNIELGDTTFFTNITKDGKNIVLETMSDVGFGLERIRWVTTKNPYFDLYSDSSNMPANVKALLSALSLLAVNNVMPTNKNSGYRTRLFSKKLATELNGLSLSDKELKYLNECVKYWEDWQESEDKTDVNSILNEYIRNCNRLILDYLKDKGYKNVSSIDINLSKLEFKKRLKSANVNENDLKQFEL